MGLSRGRVIRRVAIHASSQGTFFVDDLRDLLAAGFAALGLEVRLHDETNAFPADVDWHVVVVPDEFFSLGAGTLMRRHAPGRLVLLNTEARGSSWFAATEPFFARARMIWDIDFESAVQIAQAGYPADYLCLGYVDDARLGHEVFELPDSYWTRSLPAEVRRGSFLNAPFEARPIDVFFAGRLTRRREVFFNANASRLAALACYLHFGAAPGRRTTTPEASMRGAVVSGLVQRARIVLNVHEGEQSYFEWHRIVLQAIWNRALVVSEPCAFNPHFAPGEHYVEARSDELLDAIEFHLRDPSGRQAALSIIERAYQTLATECRLETALRGCLSRLPEHQP